MTRKVSLQKIILLLGGARSGKSRFAQEYARRNGENVLFVATATAGDEDMRRRIEKHKKDRPANWRTLEVVTNIGIQIEANARDAQLIVIDCITMLVNNIFSRYDNKLFNAIDDSVLEKEVVAEIEQLQMCMKKVRASFLIVSNEVGLGLVPDNRMGRLYRDFLGRANQMLAQESDEVYLLVAGIPLQVKPSNTL
ncbi:MAG: bifunctional adenosylcobinamide kinase/adenosylcobinamide-phosphate guanylyltransferase [Dehalococcoidales bacterium]|nr:bifunctional adenosylcobinamide kinase/adenosylcobinamide-phosphate guanylyltransferase [Dehalococcoidales bacterium]